MSHDTAEDLDRQTDNRHADRETDTQIHRYKDTQTDRQKIDRQTDTHTDKQTDNRQMVRQTHELFKFHVKIISHQGEST